MDFRHDLFGVQPSLIPSPRDRSIADLAVWHREHFPHQ